MERMKEKIKQKRKLRMAVNLAFLLLFLALSLTGKIQFWFILFLVGVLASFKVGRVYCGWICPMYTLARPVAWLYRRIGLRRISPPAFLQGQWLRYVFLAAFLGLMVWQRVRGVQLPVLPALTALLLLFVLLFEEKWWHGRVCPFGTILDLSSRPATKALQVSPEKCQGHGDCQKACPTDAIVELDSGKRSIISHRCLRCMNCAAACPVGAIGMKRA